MVKYTYILFIAILINSCELIVIGEEPIAKEVINIAQDSPKGAVYLFKTELDSNNIAGATQLLAREDGSHYLALEKYEMYYEIDRIKRLLYGKPVTKMITDTISVNEYIFNIEFDYLTSFKFRTAKIKNNWYIVNYEYQKEDIH